MSDTTFLFHTMLADLTPGAAWVDDGVTRSTTARLATEGHSAMLEFVWPADGLDVLVEDCRPMVNRVLDTFNRHVAAGNVGRLVCYMNARKPVAAVNDPGWLEWGVVVNDHYGERVIYIAHIQRRIGADVERHT